MSSIYLQRQNNIRKMNILILGSGGREHALAKKISESKKVGNLFVAPGNAGTAAIASNVSINPWNHHHLVKHSTRECNE